VDTSVETPPASGPSGGSAPAPGVPGPVRRLDPRRISLDRTVNALVGATIAMAHLMACVVIWLTGAWPAWALGLLTLAWPPMLALLVWLAIWWPPIDYRHWRYRVSDDGIEIWSGVIWRQTVAVPRSRVQHIDVSQGPLERSYGLGTLSVYTAGTQYSKVDLPGLDHGLALALRDVLLPHDAERTV
jgi:membrane protein YdbS with pleckstrin-like domain